MLSICSVINCVDGHTTLTTILGTSTYSTSILHSVVHNRIQSSYACNAFTHRQTTRDDGPWSLLVDFYRISLAHALKLPPNGGSFRRILLTHALARFGDKRKLRKTSSGFTTRPTEIGSATTSMGDSLSYTWPRYNMLRRLRLCSPSFFVIEAEEDD